MPSLWRHLDLSQAKSKVGFRAVKACVLRSGGNMTHATMFRWDERQQSSALVYLASRCKRLEYLNLRDGFGNTPLVAVVATVPRLKTLIISPDRGVNLTEVAMLLATLPHLEHAEFLGIWPSAVSPKWSGDLSTLRVLKLHTAEEDRITGSLGLDLV